ncbi:MAG: serine/threonine protein kinase [Desmonostoc vinosum HA7617-LM4]|jgi:serine/threonine protein kinase|nr:serine/threonine protein kinase [Desmonostoc vinosum HA7617-LM4]
MELDLNNEYQQPDFSALGYQAIRELGRNQQGGRITYLAKIIGCDRLVVIKEFRFASAITDWSGMKAYEREIAIMRQLNHPRIPRYLDSFEKSGVFYLVQEYKNAPSLGAKRSFQPEEIKQIALSILEILVYLQRQVTPIIHRDIKPENILVDEQLNAYLVDFGLARMRNEKITLSSFVVGTPGFMPPEEQLGYALTEASDLYSLGATLICLLTGIRSADISKLIDDKYRFHFPKLVPQINPHFRSWLMKMVERNRKHRYANAATAFQALRPIPVIGAGNGIDHLVAAVKHRKIITLLSLVTIATLTAVGATLIIEQPGSAVRQLLEMKQCQSDDC